MDLITAPFKGGIMDKEKLISVFDGYKKALTEMGFTSCEIESYHALPSQLGKEVSVGHLFWMCNRAIGLIHEGSIEKSHRWLGFVQGALWVFEIYSIHDLRKHSRPRCPHCHGPEGKCEVAREVNMNLHISKIFCENTGMFIRDDAE